MLEFNYDNVMTFVLYVIGGFIVIGIANLVRSIAKKYKRDDER